MLDTDLRAVAGMLLNPLDRRHRLRHGIPVVPGAFPLVGHLPAIVCDLPRLLQRAERMLGSHFWLDFGPAGHQMTCMLQFGSGPHVCIGYHLVWLELVQFCIALALTMTLITFQAHLSHSSTRINLGPLRYIIGDNKFHRIHHSLEAHHRRRNYGFFTTIWDTVFRTAYWPSKNEWPEVGLRDQPEPLTARDYVMFPFDRRRWQRPKVGSGVEAGD